MCTLAVYFGVFPNLPLVIAANRDEFLSRPSCGPSLLDVAAGVYGGRDEVAGGTWFGINRHGVAAALLNRRSSSPPDPSLRSRGLLCMEALRFSSAMAARPWVDSLTGGDFNPFNLLVADDNAAWVANNHAESISLRFLEKGLHLLTNLDLNDPTCPRIAASHRLFAGLIDGDEWRGPVEGFVTGLREILSRHDTALDPRSDAAGNSLCVHAGSYGTRSSTVALYGVDRHWIYFHANAPPCREPLRRHPLPPELDP